MCAKCKDMNGDFTVSGKYVDGTLNLHIESDGLPREGIISALLRACEEIAPEAFKDREPKTEDMAETILNALFPGGPAGLMALVLGPDSKKKKAKKATADA